MVIDPGAALSNKLEYGESGIGLIGVQLQGVFPDVSSNDIGQYGAVIAAVGLARLLPMTRQRRNTIRYVAVFLFGCATMILAQCRSAIMGFALAVFLIYLLSRRVVQGAVIAISGFLRLPGKRLGHCDARVHEAWSIQCPAFFAQLPVELVGGSLGEVYRSSFDGAGRLGGRIVSGCWPSSVIR